MTHDPQAGPIDPDALRWLAAKEVPLEHQEQPYGDLTGLNLNRTILDAIDARSLRGIVDDYLDLLGTSAAVYEVSGDYAHGIFASGWCRRLDARSREIGGGTNAEALASGQWHCHESCWKTSLTSMETRTEVDFECHGGIRIFAVPIIAGDEVVGSINFGYGTPPRDEAKLAEIGSLYGIDPAVLRSEAGAYEPRPPYIVELAKKRLRVAARLIAEIVQRHRAESALREANESLEATVRQRTDDLERTIRELKGSNEELETFAQSVAHDLLSPLRAIEGFSRIVRDRYRDKLDASGSHYLERIRSGALRMAKMIDDLLELASISRVEMRPRTIDVSELGGEILAELSRRDPERSVELRVDPGLTVVADPALLRIALEHLLENAWKFTRTTARPSIALVGDAPAGAFAVRDNGIGFDMQHAANLFQPFQRQHEGDGGSGVGLATVRRIAQRHGGTVWAEAVPGQGATFHVALQSEGR